MLYKIGRFLQLLGLILAPVGMAGNLAYPKDPDFGERFVLLMLCVGGGVFTLGYFLQRSARRG